MAEVEEPWVQVIGRIAIHRAGAAPVVPARSTRVLLALLVAAGPSGITLDDMAAAYWTGERPASWEIALRASISHLRSQLPADWQVTTSDGAARLVPGTGFVDAWRLEAEAPISTAPAWLSSGEPFNGLGGLRVVDEAAERIRGLLPEQQVTFTIEPALIDLVRSSPRVIGLGDAATCRPIIEATRRDDEVDIRVIGDRGLLLPLGPFAIAFPELRNKLQLRRGVLADDAVERAWEVVRNTIAIDTTSQRQRLIISEAHELDSSSLALTSLLLERGPVSNSSVIICAARGYRDVRWLDFVRRATTAGCRLIELG